MHHRGGPEQYKSKEICPINPGNVSHEAIKTAIAARYRYVVNHDYGDKSLDRVVDIVAEVMNEDPDIIPEFMRSQRMRSDHCGFTLAKNSCPG